MLVFSLPPPGLHIQDGGFDSVVRLGDSLSCCRDDVDDFVRHHPVSCSV